MDVEGHSGGLALLWNTDVNLQVKWKTFNLIVTEVNNVNGSSPWDCFCCYGPPRYKDK